MLKDLSIKVNSVKEYFSLPLKERTYYGLYKEPYSLPFNWGIEEEDGWENFYKEIRKEFPIQWFFRQWITSFDNPVTAFLYRWVFWPVRDCKWGIRLFFNPVCPRWRKVLPRHKYSDIAEIIVNSNFALILDFYYEEVLDGHVDWDADESHRKFKQELEQYVRWIEKGSKRLEDRITEALTIAHKNRIFKTLNGTKPTLDYEETYKDHNTLEKEKENKITEILTWMVTNRGFFWS